MVVCSCWIFLRGSFLERGLHISVNWRFIFSGGFIFRWRGHPNGFAFASVGEGGEGKNIQGVGDTPIMHLPTRANPGLCCNRIKKNHELLYKKRHFFTDRFLKHSLDLCGMSI